MKLGVVIGRVTLSLSEASLQGGRFRKTYLAWVSGSPSPTEGEWSWPLGDVGPDGRVSTGAADRPTLTRYLVLERRGADCLGAHRARWGLPRRASGAVGIASAGIGRGGDCLGSWRNVRLAAWNHAAG